VAWASKPTSILQIDKSRGFAPGFLFSELFAEETTSDSYGFGKADAFDLDVGRKG
jgi:hypothetical protein